MKKPFVVGDRVRVYGIYCSIVDGVIEGLGKPDRPQLTVRVEEKLYSPYPQQCRRLVKKARRRVWVQSWVLENDAGAEEFVQNTKPNTSGERDYRDYIEFVEVEK